MLELSFMRRREKIATLDPIVVIDLYLNYPVC